MTTLSSGPAPSSGTAPRIRPTMRDVAAVAGVSLKTVSRVVNDEPGVSPTLVARVQAAAKELGFRPDQAASALRRSDRRTATVGVLLEDVSNPFFSSVHRGIEDVARAQGVAVFSGSTDLDLEREREMAAAFSARRVDALIAAPTEGDYAHLVAAIDDGVSLVLVDRPAEGLDVPVVTADHRIGARRGVEHLIAHGHTRIAYVGRDREIFTARERHAGYVEAMTAAGIPVRDDYVIEQGTTRSAADDLVYRLLDLQEPPTAIFSAQNLITMGAVAALQSLGLQHTIALVGFDDFDLAGLLDPGVSVIAQDPHRIGELAAGLALGQVDRDNTIHVVPTHLIARGSGEIAC